MSRSAVVVGAAAAAAAAYGAWRLADQRLQVASDVDYLLRFSRTVRELAALERDGFNTARLFLRTAARFPTKPALVCDDQTVTFQELDAASNRVANWAAAQGLAYGDCVALFMENRIDYVAWWLGFTKLGVRVALINTSLKAQGLVHCVALVKPAWIVVGTELSEVLATAQAELARAGVAIGLSGPGAALDADVAARASTAQPTSATHRAGMNDVFGYIYTSGTTGLPKAAIMPHWRVVGYATTFVNNWRIVPSDRIYCALPLYHSAGGLGGVGMMLYAGATLIIARKFSATRFWKDVSASEATIIQYIGELCRYLLAAPPSTYDRQHRVRIAIGGGLRPDIWEAFQTRFALPEIGELYGSTEGNVSLMNHARTPADRGACGRQGWILRTLLGGRIVQFDVETGDVRRNAQGHCIDCAVGEVGELLGPIKEVTVSRFEGYTDRVATEKKVLADVFAEGDRYFRSGDLFVRDRNGYFRFVDRVGDTFRCKGQNVSTTEVELILTAWHGVLEANVYGVSVPGVDGQVCMAACVLADNVDWRGLRAHLAAHLPAYAVPAFVRVLPRIEVTGTFRHTKVSLRRDGFDGARVSDPVFWLNPASGGQYERLDSAGLAVLGSGKARL